LSHRDIAFPSRSGPSARHDLNGNGMGDLSDLAERKIRNGMQIEEMTVMEQW
jgi:hypothetical protein